MDLASIQQRMGKLNNWAIDGNSIAKDFQFKDFREALIFVNKVGDIAEKHNHHPNIVIIYNNVRLTLITHSAKSLTEKDFDVAEEIDTIQLS